MTRVPVARTVLALVVFLGALLSVVVFTLNRNASRATRQHAATQLAGAARVAASTLAVDRANLRARAGQIVGSILSPADVDARVPQVPENLCLGAAGLFEGVGQD